MKPISTVQVNLWWNSKMGTIVQRGVTPMAKKVVGVRIYAEGTHAPSNKIYYYSTNENIPVGTEIRHEVPTKGTPRSIVVTDHVGQGATKKLKNLKRKG